MPSSLHEAGMGWMSVPLVPVYLRHLGPTWSMWKRTALYLGGGSRKVLELEARMMRAWAGSFLQTMQTLDIVIWL